jgi:hypothetical protein
MVIELDVLRAIAASTNKEGTTPISSIHRPFRHRNKSEVHPAAYRLGNQSKKSQGRIRMVEGLGLD